MKLEFRISNKIRIPKLFKNVSKINTRKFIRNSKFELRNSPVSYRKKYINPKIRKLRPKKPFFKRAPFWISAGFLVALVLGCFVLFFPKIQIRHVEVAGNAKISAVEVEKAAWENMGFKLSTGLFQLSTGSIFFTDTKNLEKSLLHIFPAAQSIAVTKKFPAGLMLSLKERKPAAVFCGLAEKCFLMDDEGIIFEELGVIPADLPVVRSGVNTREFLLGEQAVQKTVMQTIIAVANDLENNFQVQAREVFIADLLIVKTSEHWQIYFYN